MDLKELGRKKGKRLTERMEGRKRGRGKGMKINRVQK